MRLNTAEYHAILNSFTQIFREGDIYLFGSRVNDHKRGGDIDLYIETEHNEHLSEKKIQFLLLLESLIGEQKIDIIFHRDNNRLIEKEAKTKGILLNTDTLKIEKYFSECDKHIMRIEHAFQKISPFLPNQCVRLSQSQR